MAVWVKGIKYGERYAPESEFVSTPGKYEPGEVDEQGYKYLPSSYETQWIDPDLCADTVQLKQKVKVLPDMFVVVGGHLIVRQAFKDLVDELEPDVHQFLPIRILPWKDDPAPEGSFYLFNILGRCECILMHHSDFQRVESRYKKGVFRWAQIGGKPKIVVSLPEIGDRKVWRTILQRHYDIYFSGDFYAAVQRLGLKDFEYYPVETSTEAIDLERDLVDDFDREKYLEGRASNEKGGRS